MDDTSVSDLTVTSWAETLFLWQPHEQLTYRLASQLDHVVVEQRYPDVIDRQHFSAAQHPRPVGRAHILDAHTAESTDQARMAA